MFALYSHIVAIVFVEVIRRFVFSYSSIWAEETARYAFIYLVWLGASAAIKDMSHIRIDIIFKFISDRSKAYLYIIGEVATFIFAAVAFYYSAEGVISTIKFESVTSGLENKPSLVYFCSSLWSFFIDDKDYSTDLFRYSRSKKWATCFFWS